MLDSPTCNLDLPQQTCGDIEEEKKGKLFTIRAVYWKNKTRTLHLNAKMLFKCYEKEKR